MAELPTVDLVDLDSRTVLLGDGTILPITDFLDGEGDDCEPREAVFCIAGTDGYGWLDIEIFPRKVTLH